MFAKLSRINPDYYQVKLYKSKPVKVTNKVTEIRKELPKNNGTKIDADNLDVQAIKKPAVTPAGR